MHVHRQLRPKPSRHLLRQLIAREKVPARRCILVEDTIANLRAAKWVGMRTAWVTQYLKDQSNTIKRPNYVDVKVKSVRQLSKNLHRLR